MAWDVMRRGRRAKKGKEQKADSTTLPLGMLVIQPR